VVEEEFERGRDLKVPNWGTNDQNISRLETVNEFLGSGPLRILVGFLSAAFE
jgi:hypothetical protein